MTDKIKCGCCGAMEVTKYIGDSPTEVNVSGKYYRLTISVPVYRCDWCEMEYCDKEAEEIRARAIEKFIKKVSQNLLQ